jgi:predicted ribosome quality control (RQC) complex YloA/Tae2 family protein
MTIARGGERRVLWIRLWGSAANAIVTDGDGVILDAFYRRPKKNEISGRPFSATAATASRKIGAAREYTVRELPGPGSFGERLERLFRDIESRGDVQHLAAQADAELARSELRVLASLEKLETRLGDYEGLERWKELGDLVTANIHAMRKGERWLSVEDFFHGNAAVEIELSPQRTPAKNAEHYYERYRKARSGMGKVEQEIEHLRATLEGIRRQREAVASNPDPAALGRAAREAARARKPLSEPDSPGLVFSSPPFRILVGRTASENDELLRRKVRGNDFWFHARDWPGAYVFVKAQPGKSLPLEAMLDAANLAVHFSKGKSAGAGDVYYTRVKYLRRAKGAKKGTVLPTQEKNLHVKLDAKRIERLKAGHPEAPDL